MLVQFDIRTEKAINSIVKALETIAECQKKHIEMMEQYQKELKLADDSLKGKPETLNEYMEKRGS